MKRERFTDFTRRVFETLEDMYEAGEPKGFFFIVVDLKKFRVQTTGKIAEEVVKRVSELVNGQGEIYFFSFTERVKVGVRKKLQSS